MALRKMSLTSCLRSMNQLSCSHTEATHSANAGITRVQASFSQAPIIVGGDVGGDVGGNVGGDVGGDVAGMSAGYTDGQKTWQG